MDSTAGGAGSFVKSQNSDLHFQSWYAIHMYGVNENQAGAYTGQGVPDEPVERT